MEKLIGKAKGFVADNIAHVKKPEADLGDVSIKKVTRDSALLNGELSVHNPYSHSIPICEVSYTLKSAGRVVVSGTLPDPGSLAASETTRLDVPLKVPYDLLISIMKDVGRDWDIDYDLQVGLTVVSAQLSPKTLVMAEQTEKAFFEATQSVSQFEEIWEGKKARQGRKQVLEERWAWIQGAKRGNRRPLSKTVRFNVLRVIPAGSTGGGKKAFTAV